MNEPRPNVCSGGEFCFKETDVKVDGFGIIIGRLFLLTGEWGVGGGRAGDLLLYRHLSSLKRSVVHWLIVKFGEHSGKPDHQTAPNHSTPSLLTSTTVQTHLDRRFPSHFRSNTRKRPHSCHYSRQKHTSYIVCVKKFRTLCGSLSDNNMQDSCSCF